jgi:hypothetical protein
MSIIGSNILAGASGQAGGGGAYEISRSVRFNSSDSAFCSRTFSSVPADRKRFTFSFWIKRCKLSGAHSILDGFDGISGWESSIRFLNANTLDFRFGGSSAYEITSTQVFRDPSAWYHFVIAADTTQATAANRVKLYVNGSEITALTAYYPAQNDQVQFALNNANNRIGQAYSGSGQQLDAYLADIHFIDGQALDPSSFGEFDTNGVWQPIDASGLTYGTNGFHLPFSDNSTAAALGTDTSGNSNTWTVNNISVTAGAGNDSLVDSPTNYGTDTGAGGEVRGNYCTWNALDNAGTLANGNLDFSQASAAFRNVRSTFGLSSGKWYWEATLSAIGGAAYIGIGRTTASLTVNIGGTDTFGYVNDGTKQSNNTSAVSYGASYTTGDVIGVAFDADNGTLTFYKNGTSQGQAYSGLTSGPYFMMVTGYNGTTWAANFGARAFSYTAPSGFKALCTTNLPEPTIADGSTAMDVALYTGNFGSKTISGLNLSPDLVWIKTRGPYSGDHNLYDAVRGTGNRLRSNTTDQEDAYGGLTAFNSNGFTLEAKGAVNGSGETYVAWTWDAGSSTVTNTEGSITSQVRANASAGFSVVTFNSGNSDGEFSVGHGLGVAPRLIIMKSRTRSGGPWWVHHLSATDTTTKYLQLSTTSAVIDNGGSGSIWGAALPTSTVFGFSVGAGRAHTQNEGIVSYAFSPVAGYSSFGSYTGNGSTDGPFVYTGFRPRWILYKRTDTTGYWLLVDALRNGFNPDNNTLCPNLSDAEDPTDVLDILSNGFKLRVTGSSSNASGGTYIFAAFAENPFQYARAR